jgi:hypothetical protein
MDERCNRDDDDRTEKGYPWLPGVIGATPDAQWARERQRSNLTAAVVGFCFRRGFLHNFACSQHM